MKPRQNKGPEQPEIPGIGALLADSIAEALMMHTHQCVARRAALAFLETLQVTEEQYLIGWAAGAYDG